MSFFPSVFISRVESRRFFKASRRTNRLSEERKNLVILSEEAVLQAIKEAALLLASSAVASRNLVVVSGKSKKNVGITRVLAKKYGFSFIDSRWIPGTITNYKEIRTGLIRFVNSFDRRFFLNEPLELDEETVNKSLKDDVLRLEKIAVKKVDAPAEEMYRFRKLSYLVRNFPSDSKKKLVRRYADLYRKFHGILSLHLPPSFILFLSPMNNKNALVEASNSKVPVVLLLHPGFSFFGNPVVVGGNLYTEKSVMLISSMILEPFFYLLDKEAGRDLENTKKKWLLANLFLKVEKSMDKKIEEGEKLN